MRGRKGGPLHKGEAGYYDEHRHWRPAPVELVPDDERVLPATVPHEVLALHPQDCSCAPCREYPNRKALVRLKLRRGR